MKTYSLTHLTDRALLHHFSSLLARERTDIAEVLKCIAEVDARRLYLQAAYPSMFRYCVHEWHLSEDVAYKYIRTARAGRRFPAIFEAVAEGRLHVSAVVIMKPHLTQATADELIAAATHKSKREIERLIAERFPRRDLPTLIRAMAPSPTSSGDPLAPGPVGAFAPSVAGPVQESSKELAPGPVDHSIGDLVPEPVAEVPRERVMPLAPQRYGLQYTIDQSTHDKLRYAQDLLSHLAVSNEIAEVMNRALDLLIPALEKQKFAATAKPRPRRRRSKGTSRYIPAEIRRAVWGRDRGQCTFVSESGKRCEAKRFIEFDHIDEVARGGQASVDRVRLRCRAHNQYTAECTFGVEFMKQKREAARRAVAESRGAASPRKTSVAQLPVTLRDEPRAALREHVAPGPLPHDADAVLEIDQVVDMDEQPCEPRDAPRHLQAS